MWLPVYFGLFDIVLQIIILHTFLIIIPFIIPFLTPFPMASFSSKSSLGQSGLQFLINCALPLPLFHPDAPNNVLYMFSSEISDRWI